MSPVHLQSEVGGSFEGAARDRRIVGVDDQVRSEALPSEMAVSAERRQRAGDSSLPYWRRGWSKR